MRVVSMPMFSARFSITVVAQTRVSEIEIALRIHAHCNMGHRQEPGVSAMNISLSPQRRFRAEFINSQVCRRRSALDADVRFQSLSPILLYGLEDAECIADSYLAAENIYDGLD